MSAQVMVLERNFKEVFKKIKQEQNKDMFNSKCMQRNILYNF